MRKANVTYERLRELLNYSPDTGALTWTGVEAWGARQAGWEAGSTSRTGRKSSPRWQGRIFIDGQFYETSHVIWAWMTGKWPTETIDHRNRNSLDNRWSNLREATLSQQKQNQGIRKDSKSGMKCIVYIKGRNRYRWRVTVNGKRLQGPSFMTAVEAYDDYCRRLPEWHGEFANVGT